METTALLIDRREFRAYLKVKDKFHILGTRASEGTLSRGTTQEEKNSITNKLAFKTAKAGTLSLPISTELDINDPTSKLLLINDLKKNINRQYEVLLVYEFLRVKGQPEQYITEKFNAIINIENMGGSGQANNIMSYNIGNAGDIMLGFVNASTSGQKYDAQADTYTSDAFTHKEDVEIEGDPEAAAAF